MTKETKQDVFEDALRALEEFGERTMSRMAKHGQGNSFGVKGIVDQRKEGMS